MTDPRHIFSGIRDVRGVLSHTLSLSLIIVILATQAPALPRPLPQLLSESRDTFKFWFHSSGWAKTVGRLTGQTAVHRQETQADRDARVARIKLFPGDVVIRVGEREFFDALAYDNVGTQVGGVKFSWQAQELATTKTVKISQTGELIAPALGIYKVTVEAVGKMAQAIVTVLDLPKVANSSNGVQVSSRDVPPSPSTSAQQQVHIEVEDEPGPGWNGNNFLAARDPSNDRGDTPGRPLHHGAGSGNFQFAAPVLSLPGRGIDVTLNAIYNSRTWTFSNSDITYDIDRDWPAPGWSLGFGRVAGLGMGGAMIIDADRTRHSFIGTVSQPYPPAIHFEGHTIDGTFIDYNTDTDNTGTINFAQATFPNGTVVRYAAPSRGAVYPLSASPTGTAT